MIEIIDTHCHLQEWFITTPDAKMDPGWFENLYSECRHETKLVMASTGNHPVLNKQGNVASVRLLGRLVEMFPDKLMGGIMVDPNDLEGALEAVEVGISELGMRFVGELVQYIHKWRTDGPEILAVIQKAIQLDVPLMFHISDESHAERLAHLAEKFPRGRFLAAHYAGGRSWRRGIEVVRGLSNISVELMAGREDHIQPIIDAIGTRRIMFGTDFAIDENPELRYRAGNPFLEALAKLKLSDTDVERMCSGNAKELMRIEG